MKKYLSFVFFFTLLISSCQTSNYTYNNNLSEVKYFQSRLHNVNKNIITLADGSIWKTNRFVIAVNLTEVFFVLNYVDIGYVYINGTKYSVSKYGGGDEGYRYLEGYLSSIKNIQNNVIELTDGSSWDVINKGEIDLDKWLSTAEVVISVNKNILINPYRIEAIRVKEKIK